MLAPNELIGREIRVVKAGSSAGDVYVAATVISHLGTAVHIADPGNAIKNAWSSCDKELTAVYDLHEGYQRGVVDSKSTGNWNYGGWPSEPCTYLHVDNGPFDTGMQTLKSEETSNPLNVTLTSGSETPVTVLVLGVTDSVTGAGERKLVVKGNNLPAWVVGGWYAIDGKRDRMRTATGGTWASIATQPGNITVFNVQAHAFLSEYTQGWTLQPDINQAVYLPITEVNPGNHTITVSGLYAAIGTAGTHWRIYAPPGTETQGPYAGTLSLWASAESSRCLYNGYRFESPLAGFHDYTGTGQVIRRQTGDNFAGQHYTLHRHYDPVLMRFTSPDPIAAPFSNLGAYAGNNPAGSYDPDGLEPDEFESIEWTGLAGLGRAVKRYVDFYNDPEYRRGHKDGLDQGWEDGFGNLLRGLIPGPASLGETTTIGWTTDQIGQESGVAVGQEIMQEHGAFVGTAYILMRSDLGERGGQFVDIGIGRHVDPYAYGYEGGYATGSFAKQTVLTAPLMVAGARFPLSRATRPYARRTVPAPQRLGRLRFESMEVRAVRDLSHVSVPTLRQMSKDGFAPKLPNGEPLVLHHHRQSPYGPIIEMPRTNHRNGNRNQHPDGNTRGAGLTPQQRAAFDAWRIRYWKQRGTIELRRRGVDE